MNRILEVVPALAAGGIENLLCNYFLDNEVFKDFQIDFVTHESEGNVKERLENEGFKVFYVPPKHLSLKKWYKTMKSIISDGHYDIVHAHQSLKSFLSVFIAKKCGVKVRIIHAHTNTKLIDNAVTKIKNRLLRLLCKSCTTHYFSCSLEAAEYQFGKKNLTKTFIMPNAIDSKKFAIDNNTQNVMKEKLNNPSHVVIHVGRFTREKNHDFIIDIVDKVSASIKDVIFVFLGDGPEKNRIELSAKNRSLSKNCLFMGNVNNVQDYLSVSDVQILPSLYEGFPVSAIEAQFMGIPILLSDVITREVKISEKAQFLPFDTTSWAETILNILSKDNDKERDEDLIHKSVYNIDNARQLLCDKYLACIEDEK